MQLRQYQVELIEKLRSALRRNRRVIVQSATGSGKTAIACDLVRRSVALGNRVAYTVPRCEILEQTARKLDEMGISYFQLEAGKKVPNMAGHQVLLAMAPTLDRRQEKWHQTAGWVPNAVIVDECHYAPKQVERLQQLWPQAFFVGLSATPCRLGKDGQLRKLYQETVCGPSIKALQAFGYLVPCRTFAVDAPDLSQVSIVAGEYQQDELERAFLERKIVVNTIREWRKLAAGRRTILFASGVDHSLQLVTAFRSAGVRADHVDADTKPGDRQAALDRLRRKEIDILCNVGLFVEGLDLVEVECIVCATKTKSLSRFLQMVGRGLRPSPHSGKTNLLVMDCGQNVDEHGLPQSDHNWADLAAEKKREAVKKCPKCSYINPAANVRCDGCGEILPIEPAKSEDAEGETPQGQTVVGELKEVTDESQYPTAEARKEARRAHSRTVAARPCPPQWQSVRSTWDSYERIRVANGYALPERGVSFGFVETNCLRKSMENGDDPSQHWRGKSQNQAPPRSKVG